MSDLSVTILPETPKDAQAIERLHERTFGPGRFVLSAYRLREHVDHLLDLSFTARIGTLMVGSVRQLPICIGDTPALMLGPLTVEPPFRSRGVGRLLLDRSLKDAREKGHRLVILVGDEPYYSRVGFKADAEGHGRPCPARSITAACWSRELVDGAFNGVSGADRPGLEQGAVARSLAGSSGRAVGCLMPTEAAIGLSARTSNSQTPAPRCPASGPRPWCRTPNCGCFRSADCCRRGRPSFRVRRTRTNPVSSCS